MVIPSEAQVTSPPLCATKGKVMIVDDNPMNLKLLEDILEPCGYEVRSFPRGQLAIAAARVLMPDLILADINMPEMSGYELCRRFKTEPGLTEIPVIFLSALNGREERLKGFRAGGVDYVSKPFEVEEIKARVDTHVRLRHFQLALEADNCHLQQKVEFQVKMTAAAQMETIFALAKLAESRDEATGKHIARVQTFCKLLATGLSDTPKYSLLIDKEWIRKIFQAAPLHDIGKVAIPDSILLKPGRLTEEEFAVMKTHATLGAETLRAVHSRYPANDLIEMGIDIAQSHHERWDGRGYPHGLSGEDIPLCARILAVADCYDAIRSRRCYKPASPHDETSDLIRRGSGTQFDPSVVAVFNELEVVFDSAWDRISSGPEVDDISDAIEPDLMALSRRPS